MRYMCAERNKLRRVFSTAIDLVKAPIVARALGIVRRASKGILHTRLTKSLAAVTARVSEWDII